MAHLARDKYRGDWVLSNDADEFWYPLSRDFKTALRDDANALSCTRFQLVPDEEALASEPYGFYQNRLKVVRPMYRTSALKYGERNTIPFYWGAPSSKLICALPQLVAVGVGNTTADFLGGIVRKPCPEIVTYHFPVRTYRQFERKVVNAGAAYASNKQLPKEAGWHLRYMYETWKAGKLEEEYRRIVPDRATVAECMRMGILEVDCTIYAVMRNEYRHSLDDEPSRMYGSSYFEVGLGRQPEYAHVAAFLGERLNFASVLDLGCGCGGILKELHARYGKSVMGLDASRNSSQFAAGELAGNFEVRDLRLPLYIGMRDLVICTEVAEHLEEKYADNLVDNICRHTREWTCFSVGNPDQSSGRGHANLQPLEYWIAKFAARGFAVCPGITSDLRAFLGERLQQIRGFVDNSLVLRREDTGGGPRSSGVQTPANQGTLRVSKYECRDPAPAGTIAVAWYEGEDPA
jgi:SAM-dependent methyltransferase